jgi:hypothetical protein
VLCTVLLVDGILSKPVLMLNGISVSRFRDFLSDTLLVLGVATVLLSILQPFLILSYGALRESRHVACPA